MGNVALWSILGIAASASLLAVICAVVCFRAASELHSAAKFSKQTRGSLDALELETQSLDQRLRALAARQRMAHAREAKSMATSPATEPNELLPTDDKATIRRKLGLVGAGAQRAAYNIHTHTRPE